MTDMPRAVWYAGISLCLVGLGATINVLGLIEHNIFKAGFGLFQIFSCSVMFAFQLKRAVLTSRA